MNPIASVDQLLKEIDEATTLAELNEKIELIELFRNVFSGSDLKTLQDKAIAKYAELDKAK